MSAPEADFVCLVGPRIANAGSPPLPLEPAFQPLLARLYAFCRQRFLSPPPPTRSIRRVLRAAPTMPLVPSDEQDSHLVCWHDPQFDVRTPPAGTTKLSCGSRKGDD